MDGTDRKPGGDVHNVGLSVLERLRWSKRGVASLLIYPQRDAVGTIPEPELLMTTNIKEFKEGRGQWLTGSTAGSWGTPVALMSVKFIGGDEKQESYLYIFLKVYIKLSSGSEGRWMEKQTCNSSLPCSFPQLKSNITNWFKHHGN